MQIALIALAGIKEAASSEPSTLCLYRILRARTAAKGKV
jgi:hypothetical protein